MDITSITEPTHDLESFYESNGDIQVKKVDAMSTPYFYAICGTPNSFSFDRATGHL